MRSVPARFAAVSHPNTRTTLASDSVARGSNLQALWPKPVACRRAPGAVLEPKQCSTRRVTCAPTTTSRRRTLWPAKPARRKVPRAAKGCSPSIRGGGLRRCPGAVALPPTSPRKPKCASRPSRSWCHRDSDVTCMCCDRVAVLQVPMPQRRRVRRRRQRRHRVHQSQNGTAVCLV